MRRSGRFLVQHGFAAGLAACAMLAFTGAAEAQGRDAVRIVGSSTVFPFSTAVAEQFGAKTDFATPIVESTGTGGGLKLFCDGLGLEHPDIANASRRIKASEFRRCVSNGVQRITEIPIGFDGIVLANAEEAPTFSVTKEHIFLALARRTPTSADDCTLQPNPYETWFDIDPQLPPFPIEVFGPPITSGTRDAFVEIAMEGGAGRLACLSAIQDLTPEAEEAPDAYLARAQALISGLTLDDVAQGETLVPGDDIFVRLAHTLRDDGAWIDAGENDNTIVNTLVKTPTALGVFGFSFLDQNEDRLKGALVDGVAPSFDAIEAGDYQVARSLYFYLKKGHLNAAPGLQDYALEFTSDAASDVFGYLSEKGLIPPSSDGRAEAQAAARDLPILVLDDEGAFDVTPDAAAEAPAAE